MSHSASNAIQVLAALRDGRTPDPESYDCVTVIFCEIVDFNDLSVTLQPQQVGSVPTVQPHKLFVLDVSESDNCAQHAADNSLHVQSSLCSLVA